MRFSEKSKIKKRKEIYGGRDSNDKNNY